MDQRRNLHPKQFSMASVPDEDDDDYMEGDDPEKDWRRREAKFQSRIDDDDAYY